jgi:molybdenum cofactor cytidylyltransferase
MCAESLINTILILADTMSHPTTIAAIILAAGAASRMGQPKQLLEWEGQPLIRRAAESALAGGCERVLVVVGAARAAVVAALVGLPVEIVENPNYAAGQSTSLRAGLAALGPEAAAALVLLGDQPFVTAPILQRIVDTWRDTGAPIVAPVYAGQRGNPVLFARSVFPELLTIEGDQGARAILAADHARVTPVHFDDPRPLTDIDTPEEYRRLRNDE